MNSKLLFVLEKYVFGSIKSVKKQVKFVLGILTCVLFNTVVGQHIVNSNILRNNDVSQNLFIEVPNEKLFDKHTPQQELVAKRAQNSKHFINPDGSIDAIISGGSLHYLNQSGNWDDINTEIIATNNEKLFAYKNTTNTIKSYFPGSQMAETGVQIVNDNNVIYISKNPEIVLLSNDNSISVLQRTAVSKASVCDNKIVYESAFDNADIEFIVEADMLKHNIVLHSFPECALGVSGDLGFAEEIVLPNGWSLFANGRKIKSETMLSGGLSVVDEKGKIIYTFPVPEVYEAENQMVNLIQPDGTSSVGRTYLVKPNGSSYKIITIVPADWLRERNFPVVVDPTTTVYGNWGGWLGTSSGIVEGNPSIYVYVDNTHRAWTRFDITSIPDDASISEVKLALYCNAVGATTAVTVSINDVTGAIGPYSTWNSAAATDLGNGAYYNFSCTSAGTTYGQYTLGATANSHLESRLAGNLFAIGLSSASTTYKRFTSNSNYIVVTYVTGPPCSTCQTTNQNITAPTSATWTSSSIGNVTYVNMGTLNSSYIYQWSTEGTSWNSALTMYPSSTASCPSGSVITYNDDYGSNQYALLQYRPGTTNVRLLITTNNCANGASNSTLNYRAIPYQPVIESSVSGVVCPNGPVVLSTQLSDAQNDAFVDVQWGTTPGGTDISSDATSVTVYPNDLMNTYYCRYLVKGGNGNQYSAVAQFTIYTDQLQGASYTISPSAAPTDLSVSLSSATNNPIDLGRSGGVTYTYTATWPECINWGLPISGLPVSNADVAAAPGGACTYNNLSITTTDAALINPSQGKLCYDGLTYIRYINTGGTYTNKQVPVRLRIQVTDNSGNPLALQNVGSYVMLRASQTFKVWAIVEINTAEITSACCGYSSSGWQPAIDVYNTLHTDPARQICTQFTSDWYVVDGLNISTGNDITVCEGSTINFTGGLGSLSCGETNYLYSWIGPSGFSSSSRNPSIPNASSSYIGEYTYMVYDKACFGYDKVNVAVDPTAVGGTVSANPSASVCAGSSVQLSVTGHAGNLQWQTNASGSWQNISGQTGTSYTTPAMLSNTSYRVVASSGVCPNNNSNTMAVNVTSPATSGLASNDYVWTGASSSEWNGSNNNNWLQYSGSAFSVPASVPGDNSNVFIRKSGTCFSTIPNVSVSNVAKCNNLTVDEGNTLTLTGAIGFTANGNIANNGTITATGSPALNVKGNFITGSTGTFNPATSTVYLLGTGTQTIINYNFHHLNIDKTSGTATLGYDVRMTGDLIISAGSFDVSTSNYNVTVYRNYTNNGTFNPRNGIFIFGGDAVNSTLGGSGILNFYDLYVEKTPGYSYSVTPTKAIAVTRDLYLSSGTFINGAFTHAVSGNFIKSNGRLSMNATTNILTVNGNFIVTGGDVAITNGARIDVSGNVSISGNGSFVPSDVRLWMVGGNNAGIWLSGTDNIINQYFYVNKSGGAVVSAMTNLSIRHFMHSSGGFNVNGYNVVNTGVYYATGTCNLIMSAGLFSVGSNGYNGGTYSPFYAGGSWTGSISGGTIRVLGGNHASCGNVCFVAGASMQATGGTFEMVGTDNAIIQIRNASNIAFHNLTLGDGSNAKTVSLWNDANQTLCNVRGNLNINNSATFNSNSKPILVSGNYTNNGIFTCGTGTLTFNGTAVQEIRAGASNFYNVVFNNTTAGTADLNISQPITITGTGTFTNGVVYYTGTGSMLFGSGAGSNGGSNNSYVDGPVAKLGTTAFTFPTGKGVVWAPVGIAAPAVSSTITAEYNFVPGPLNWTPAYMCTEADIHHTSGVEHWNMTTTNATPAVTLYWKDGARSGITDLVDLAVAHWNGNCWEYKGGSASGSIGNGMISSTIAFTSYSPVTFASRDNINPLPVEIIAFSADCIDEGVKLVWQTATELNNEKFVVLRSYDAVAWHSLGDVQGMGNSNTINHYHFIDRSINSEGCYYRLHQFDYNGESALSDIVYIQCENVPNKPSLSVYPNPFNSLLHIELGNWHTEDLQIEIFDLLGKQLGKWNFSNVSEFGRYSLQIGDLPPAMYYLKITSEQGVVTQKIERQ